MTIDQQIHEGPLPPAEPWRPTGAGAVVAFEGVVRLMEDGRELHGIEYEVYEPMTSRQLRKLAEDTARRYALIGLRVAHSVGHVPVGDCSFRLRTAAVHRKEALAAQEAFIEAMKRDVPIWKRPVWRASSAAVAAPQQAEVSHGCH